MTGHKRADAARALKEEYGSLVADQLGNWRKACRKFGVKVKDLALHAYASREQVIEGLRRWAAVPGVHAGRIYWEDRALRSAAYRIFGSWPAAVKAAGLSFVDGRNLRFRRRSSVCGHRKSQH